MDGERKASVERSRNEKGKTREVTIADVLGNGKTEIQRNGEGRERSCRHRKAHVGGLGMDQWERQRKGESLVVFWGMEK